MRLLGVSDFELVPEGRGAKRENVSSVPGWAQHWGSSDSGAQGLERWLCSFATTVGSPRAGVN